MENGVKLSTEGYGNGITFLHSHTNATPPSIIDFQKLLDSKIDKICVICYNNDSYIAYIGEGKKPSQSEFFEVAQEIGVKVDFELIAYPEFEYWSISERNYMAIREQSIRITKYIGWTLEGGRIDE